MLWGNGGSGGGEEESMGGGEKNLCGMPYSASDVAECGEMIRTVFPDFGLVERGMSDVH